MTLSISLALVSAQQYDFIVIEKPKWCNSASMSYYYTFMESQEKYKYPCAKYLDNNM